MIARKVWAVRRENGGGFLREAGTHSFDRVRFYTGGEFGRLAARLTPWTALPWPVPEATTGTADAEFALLAELTDGTLVSLLTMWAAVPARDEVVLRGDQGTLTTSQQGATLQRVGDAGPVALDVPESDRVPAATPLLHHTWHRLIADLVTAVRAGDVAHATVPHLPHVADGLRAQEVVAAAERADTERRWIDIAELG